MVIFSKKKVSLLFLFSILSQLSFSGDISEVELTGIDNNRIVKIRFKGDVVVPKAFAQKKQNQVTLNFSGAKTLVDRNIIKYDDPILSQISLSNLGNTTRVLVKMKTASDFRLTKHGEEVWLYINPTNKSVTMTDKKPSEPVPEGQYQVSSEPKSSNLEKNWNNQNPINFDFRRQTNGDGSVVLTVNSQHPTPQVKKFNNRIQITLKNYNPQSESQNTYDVTEFNTAVRKVEINRQGVDAIITIYTNASSWDYQLNNEASQIVVSISNSSNIISNGSGGSQVKHYSGGRLSLDFQNVDVRTVLQILAKEGKANIIASDAVSGKLTLKLDNVRWDEALDLVLQTKNLAMRKVGTIINIAPATEFEAHDRQELQMERDQIEMGGLQSRSFRLKYKNAVDFQKMLTDANSGSGNSILSKRGSIMIDSGTNTLIVTDIPTNIKKVERMLQQIDIPRDQVMISARIVEVSDTYARNFGMRLNTALNHDNNYYSGVSSGDVSGMNTRSSSDSLPANINIPFSPGVNGAMNGFSIIRSTNSAYINLAIAAMQEEGEAKIISTPNVLALNGEEAVLEDGVDVGYRVNQGQDEGYSVQFRRAVTGIKVTPQITPDGNIVLSLEVNKDGVLNETNISVKKLTTKAMIEDGGTLVLGGIYDETNNLTTNKIPYLSDIPIVGKAFTMKSRNNSRRQVLIFVTPKIVKNSDSILNY